MERKRIAKKGREVAAPPAGRQSRCSTPSHDGVQTRAQRSASAAAGSRPTSPERTPSPVIKKKRTRAASVAAEAEKDKPERDEVDVTEDVDVDWEQSRNAELHRELDEARQRIKVLEKEKNTADIAKKKQELENELRKKLVDQAKKSVADAAKREEETEEKNKQTEVRNSQLSDKLTKMQKEMKSLKEQLATTKSLLKAANDKFVADQDFAQKSTERTNILQERIRAVFRQSDPLLGVGIQPQPITAGSVDLPSTSSSTAGPIGANGVAAATMPQGSGHSIASQDQPCSSNSSGGGSRPHALNKELKNLFEQ